jgi:serine/threonine protein kinase
MAVHSSQRAAVPRAQGRNATVGSCERHAGAGGKSVSDVRRFRRCEFEVRPPERTNGFPRARARARRRSALTAPGAPAQVAGRIGKGAYGGVWQATVVSTKQEVVLKVVFPDPDLVREQHAERPRALPARRGNCDQASPLCGLSLISSCGAQDPVEAATSSPTPNQLNSFRREIEILAMVGQHPNIAGLLGITSDLRVLVLQEAMIDLHKMIKSQKRGLALSVVRRWSRELLAGTAYLHSIGIMHRDLKPSNLLIYRDMTLKIGDFGLSCVANVSETLAVRREMCTVWYRAPELIMGAEVYSSSIDVWSCGIIMLEMLVGRCPTAGRVEDVCKCPKPTHFNYNHDQLAKTFRLVGTPTDRAFLAQMHCLEHFAGWSKCTSKLEDVICNALQVDTRARSHAGGADGQSQMSPGAANTHAEDSAHLCDVKPWATVLAQLLTVNPAHRPSLASVLEHPFWTSMTPSREKSASSASLLLDQRGKLPRAVSGSAVSAATASSSFAQSLTRAQSNETRLVQVRSSSSARLHINKLAAQPQSTSRKSSGDVEGSDTLHAGGSQGSATPPKMLRRRRSVSETDVPALADEVAPNNSSESASHTLRHEDIRQARHHKGLGARQVREVRAHPSSSLRQQYRATLPPMLTMRERNARSSAEDRMRTDAALNASVQGLHVGAAVDRERERDVGLGGLSRLSSSRAELQIDATASVMSKVDHNLVGRDRVAS